MTSSADIEGVFRYALTRSWPAQLSTTHGYHPGNLGWCMLNPSTADHRFDDPTIRRCIDFAKTWGYGGIRVVNLFAWRSSSPKELLKEAGRPGADVVGPRNDAAILACAQSCPTVIVAWGREAARIDPARADAVMRLLRSCPNVLCLGRTQAGHPRHPLYLPKLLQPAPYSGPGR